MIYLLDTNLCIAAMRGNPKVVQALHARSPEDCAVSMVNVFELYAGVFRCNDPVREWFKVATFLEPFHLLPFDWDAVIKTAEIRYPLEKAGMKIGLYDLQLSGQALSLDLILVTHNTREFNRVNGLRVEDLESEGGYTSSKPRVSTPREPLQCGLLLRHLILLRDGPCILLPLLLRLVS